jgi:hypothetical protein
LGAVLLLGEQLKHGEDQSTQLYWMIGDKKPNHMSDRNIGLKIIGFKVQTVNPAI